MRSFRDHPAFQAYEHNHKDKILVYIEMMYSIGSDLNKIDNLDERKRTAASRSGLTVALSGESLQTILDDEDKDFKLLRHRFLSEYQFHSKYQNLMTYQQMLWNIHKTFAVDDHDLHDDKVLQKWDKSIDLMEKLEGLTARLFSEIYGDGKTIDIAKDQMKAAMGPEERLKQTKSPKP